MSIKNLEGLIAPYLRKHEKQFVSYQSKNLLAVGENYGSTMLSVDVKVRNKHRQEEVIHCVAKTLPPGKTVQEFFNVSVTFKKEVRYYTTIVPALEEFGKEMGTDNLVRFSAKCLGARISLDPNSDVVDEDAVIVLENLKNQNYVVGNRFEGADLEIAQLVLRDMATMHAAVIAFKLAKREEFEEKIRPNLEEALVYVAPDEMIDDMVKYLRLHASKNPACLPLLERIGEGTRKLKEYFVYSQSREPFGTVVHNDMWINNILTRYVDGKPTGNIFVDYQVMKYGSPARDAIFFLYSSVRIDVIEIGIDELLKFYYDHLIDSLAKLKCDTSLFPYEMFMEEVNMAGKTTEFPHQIFMLAPLFTVRGKAIGLDEWGPEDMVPSNVETLHESYYERLHFIILDFAKRNWI